MEYNKKVKLRHSIMTPLFLIFLVLKLTKVINWSWWWITSPLWIPIAIVIGSSIIILIFTFFSKK